MIVHAAQSTFDQHASKTRTYEGTIVTIKTCINNVLLVTLDSENTNLLYSLKYTKQSLTSALDVDLPIQGTSGNKYFCIRKLLPLVVEPGFIMKSVSDHSS